MIVKTYAGTKYLYLEQMLFFLTFYPEKNINFQKEKKAVHLFPALIINQHIRMISKESCDAEGCSNGWWKFSFASQE